MYQSSFFYLTSISPNGNLLFPKAVYVLTQNTIFKIKFQERKVLTKRFYFDTLKHGDGKHVLPVRLLWLSR